MGILSQDMKDIAAKTAVYMLATSDKAGKPNGVPIGIVQVKDDCIVLADNFMNKTRKNLEENPVASVTYWSGEDRYGYQLKGKVTIETSGENFMAMTQKMESMELPFKPKAVVVLTPEEAYYIGAGQETGNDLMK